MGVVGQGPQEYRFCKVTSPPGDGRRMAFGVHPRGFESWEMIMLSDDGVLLDR